MYTNSGIAGRRLFRLILIGVCIALALLSCGEKEIKSIGSFERIDPALDEIVGKDAKIQIIAEGFDWTEGPLWIEDKKMLLFCDIPPNTIYKWTEEKGKELYLTPSGYTGTQARTGEPGSNGLALNSKGQLVLCQHGDRKIALMDAALDSPRPKFITLADSYSGKKFDSPNDLVFLKNGDLYFTDPPYGLEQNAADPKKEAPYQGVYKLTPEGKVVLLIDTITRPNGIAFFPEEKTMLVANSDSMSKKWYAYDLGSGDSLINPRIFYDATEAGKTDKGAPDGLKIDKKGNVFASGPGGVWIFDKNAKLLGKIKIPEFVSNVALANDDKTLYVTADMYVLKIDLR